MQVLMKDLKIKNILSKQQLLLSTWKKVAKMLALFLQNCFIFFCKEDSAYETEGPFSNMLETDTAPLDWPMLYPLKHIWRYAWG